ncbi:protein-methionine-sulfoxide reductase heme-binding subunit MsrQ [Rhodophyticola sp. CCM32]|uniref:protein-methionine-sulfoxide reductase heme-binding subunit MsrQ n=1 Tax=Rhodophyticola sp. CCM32 TaxID=2916397 RepID=UPI00107F6AAA|nr:protein-methionine-sulfoxide reductase heme-binding subunit MsrQ [Rhodophyticola sp. CCM32]QBY02453.1 protein-methionine-sulfoxide reductase heme-binding subunit MsrQ [Rhodophyticola sp. CCM32]
MTFVDRINAFARWLPAWTVYLTGFVWAAWLFYRGATGALGVDPIEALEHAYGKLALQLLLAGLTITPLRIWARVNLMKFRRSIGLVTFFYMVAHLSVWALLDVRSLSRIWADILDRPYVTIGMAAFILLIPLAITSNDRSVRRLGAEVWCRLHKLVYPAAILGAVHYIWLTKGFQPEPILYLAAILGLLALRVRLLRTRLAR